MNKATGTVLLIVGVALIIRGFNAPNPVGPGEPNAFAGALTHKTLWLLLGGSAAVVVGAALTFGSSRKA